MEISILIYNPVKFLNPSLLPSASPCYMYVQFDRILAWESANIIPERVFEGVPRDWIGRYQYYSAAAVVEPDSVRNPFTVLKTVARASDFVVVKLDLDNPVVEMAFIQQLLDDPELHKIVDE